MSPPISRLVLVMDHDTMRDGFRHLLDASKRLSQTVTIANEKNHLFPAEVMTALDGAITDLMAARDAFQDAEIATLNTPVIRGIK